MGIWVAIGAVVLAFSAGTVLGGLLGCGKRADLERQLAQAKAWARKIIGQERKKAEQHKQIAAGAAGRKREASELLYRLGKEIEDFLGPKEKPPADALIEAVRKARGGDPSTKRKGYA